MDRKRVYKPMSMFAIAALPVYFLLAPVVAQPLYSKLMFYPNFPVRYDKARYQSIQSLQGVPKEEISIPTTNGAKLNAWFFRKPGADKLVIVDHGNAGNLSDRSAIADDLLQLGTSVLLYDYQGYGLSEGKPSVANICNDGLSVYDFARNELGYDSSKIILFGESLGCAVSCNTSSQRPCSAVILLSAFSSLKKIAGQRFAIFNLYPAVLFPRPNLNNVAILAKQHPPLLILHGQLDGTIPVSHGEQLYKQAAEPKEFVMLPHSGHFVDQQDHEVFMTAVQSFLKGTAKPAHT